MKPAPPTDDEQDRLQALRAYAILDTPNEPEFDDLVALAAQVCAAPIALVSLVDEHRQWFKASFGLQARQTPREVSFCGHALLEKDLLVVPDTARDERFADNPLVTGDPGIRFYAGAPLRTADGQTLGTLCVIDRQARELSEAQRRGLLVLSRHVMAQLELRRQSHDTRRTNRALLSLLEDERQAERAVRASEALNRGVLDSMPAQIAVLDRTGRILTVNEAWRRFTQAAVTANPYLPAQTAAGTNYLQLCAAAESTPEHAGNRVCERLRMLLAGESEGFTLEYAWRQEGEKRCFLLTAMALQIEGGGAILNHIDITARKQAEESVRIGRQRFEMLARATNDAIRDWNLIDDVVWWSDGFETLFGFRRGETDAHGAAWLERIHAEDRARIEAAIQQAIDDGDEVWSARYRFRRRDGGYAHVLERGQLIHDENGRAVRLLAGMTDVTERLALEEQLRQAHRLEAVGQLTGGVAHDFNNLLTVILGNAELLNEALEADGAQRESAEMIVGAAKSAAELTKRLLAFARKQTLNPTAIEANRLIADMSGLLRRTLGEHIDIDIQGDPALWPALVDAAQLENALLNLCINARDSMPAGGRLVIETGNAHLDEAFAARHIDLRAGDYVRVSVTDTGCGIPAEVISRVFDPFFTTKDKGKGTGLGLAMVYGFVKQSGGHIGIDSAVGRGTSVRMYLPRIDAAPPASAAATGRFKVAHGTETILLVEDDEAVRHLARGHLRALGYPVLQARDGTQALELLDRHPQIDLLFTDIVMPGGLSGRQLADVARQRRPGLRVLFTSGYSDDAITHHGRLDPGVELLSKPYRRAELAARIRALLDGG